MKRPVQVLIVATLSFWVVAATPLLYRQDQAGVVRCVAAGVICLASSATSLAWLRRKRQAARGGLVAPAFLAMGGRLLAVLGPALALSLTLEVFHHETFWIWILVFYLYTLALETYLAWRERFSAGD